MVPEQMKEDSLEEHLVHVVVKFEIKKKKTYHTTEDTVLLKIIHLFKKFYAYPE